MIDGLFNSIPHIHIRGNLYAVENGIGYSFILYKRGNYLKEPTLNKESRYYSFTHNNKQTTISLKSVNKILENHLQQLDNML